MRTLFVGIIIAIQLYLSEGWSVLDLTSSDINDFIDTLDVRVVYFETKDSQEKFPFFLQEYADAASRLESYGLKLAKVNCSTEKHVHCTSAVPSLLIFKNSEVVKTLPLKNVGDEPAIVANILHRFLMKDELALAQTEDAFKNILDEAKGKTDVVLANIRGIGMKDHRNFLEVAFTFGDSFKFCLSTKLPVDAFGSTSKLKVFLCKEKDCEIRPYFDDFKIITLATFLQYVNLPQVIVLGEDERIPYKDTTFPINLVYVFVRHEKNLESTRQDFEKIATSVKDTVGIVIIQVENHVPFLKQFGLADDSGYPAVGFIPSHKVQKDDMEYVDIFTSHDRPWRGSNSEDFIRKLLKNSASIYGESAETRSFTIEGPGEYESLVTKNDVEYLFVAFCTSQMEECMSSFTYEYQRLSRTFERHFQRRSASKRNIEFAIILSKDFMDPSFNIDSYPSLRLHRKNQPISKYTAFTGATNYYEMLEFVKETTGESYVLALPSSGLDYIELNSPQDGVQDTPLMAGEETVRSDSTDGEGYDEEKPPEEIEDDEVAAAGYELYYTKALKDEHVIKLNDTSFNDTIKKYDIAVIFFFLPWEARSQAFTPSYAAAVHALRARDESNVIVDAFQVNCFDWEDVCRKENVLLFPTIRIYRKMKPNIDYHGALDQTSLVRTLKLLQAPLPITLTSDGEAVGFEVGKYPMPYIRYTDISVLGLFPLESSDEQSIFQTVAKKMEGEYLFGYAMGEVASKSSLRLDVDVLSIVLFKRNDPVEKKVVFEGGYTEESIIDFVKKSSLPLYGELTPLNFPVYHSMKHPLLVVFKYIHDSHVDRFVSSVIKSGAVKEVRFCWVDISLKVNQDILKEYTKTEERQLASKPVLVLVNHDEGKTYTYKDKLQEDHLISWIERCLNKVQKQSGELKRSEWKPRLEGYDFLAKIKEDQESGESARLGKKDPWSERENDESLEDEEDEHQQNDEIQDSVKHNSEHSNQRFHTAFHAKRQSRMNERQQTVLSPHTTHTHNEL